MIIIVMGVSGCGKTTVSQALAEQVGWEIAEADDYHPASNKRRMSEGTPLTDEDRIPWLTSLQKVIQRWTSKGENGIVTCSALKRKYRDILRSEMTGQKLENVLFVHLDGPFEVIEERMRSRTGHFMPSHMLQSQFETLERLSSDEPGFEISVQLPTNEIILQILQRVN